jgi:hypothetical protein
MLNRPPQIQVNESVAFAEIDGEAVLLNVDSGIYFGLDGVGTDIWNLLTQGATEDEIVCRLVEEYDAEAAQVRLDVAALLAALRDNGLVRVGDD